MTLFTKSVDVELAPAIRPRRSRKADRRRDAVESGGVRTRGAKTAVFIGILLTLVAFAFPLLVVLNTALKTQAEFYTNPSGVTTSFAFDNFLKAWEQADFGRFLGNSVLYTLTAALLGTLACFLVAFPVSRNIMKRSKVWNTIFVFSLFLPIALVTQFQLLLQMGLYNTQVGFILIMGATVGIGPLLLSGYMKSIPVELDEAVALDGAGYFRYLFTFVLPLSMPVLVTVFILQALACWNEIILATVLFSDDNLFPASLGLRTFQGEYSSQWPLLAAATIIVAAPVIVLYVSLQRFFQAGALNGSLKG